MLDLNLIRIDGGTQSRAELNQDTVAEYAEAYKSGAEFPPVTVFFDGKDRWLADGFHRYFGAKTAGLTTILEKIIPGTRQHAFEFSLGANHTHGLKRTNADKRHAVELALNNAVLGKQSDNAIAQACAVSTSFVGDVRRSIFSPTKDAPTQKVVTRNGKTYKQETARIGKGKPPTTAEPVEAPTAVEHERRDVADESASFIAELADENETLRARLAVGVMEGTEEEKREAAETITHLRLRVKALEAEVVALRASRDGFQREAAELRKQIKMNEKELKKARAAA